VGGVGWWLVEICVRQGKMKPTVKEYKKSTHHFTPLSPHQHNPPSHPTSAGAGGVVAVKVSESTANFGHSPPLKIEVLLANLEEWW
jgi:hypothetical protein